MKIKRIKKIKIHSYEFCVKWDPSTYGASFNYIDREIIIGTKSNRNDQIFELIMHELQEIAATELGVRLARPDCDSDYIFVYDHRQHESICNMVAGWIREFFE